MDFGRDVQPILSENCFHCHGPDAARRKAKLRLDTPEGAAGKDGGPAVIKPGDGAHSELVNRIFSTDPETQMPPPRSNRRLTDAQKQTLKRWIDEGAKYAQHWAFQKPVRPPVPTPPSGAIIHNPIDAFLADRLAREGLRQAPEADRAKLLRRVSLALTGLPPTPEETEAFLKEAEAKPQAAYAAAVERLLASPRYGERMVWEWLEAARYADTNGYQGDPTRPMWYWRDWAIAAFNANVPFDRFTVEQVAGDLLPSPSREQLIATGFHRNHMINGEGGRIAEESRVEYVFDRVETTGAVWLGLTLNCCRCHDHKYDPIAQKEYYRLGAYFNSIDESGGSDAGGGLAHPVLSLATPAQEQEVAKLKAAAEQAKKEREAADQKAAAALPKPTKDQPVDERVKQAQAYLDVVKALKAADEKATAAKKAADAAERALPRTMVLRERAKPRETFVLFRGAYDKPGAKVTHGTPAALPPLPADAPANRLALARWLVAPDQPLTPRVVVNRLWAQFFGTGLVKTPEDFGHQGERPSHPELLDWLACEFVASGWDLKHVVRLIVTSHAFRQASQVTPELLERDPANRLLARGPRYRLPSWMIRDQALYLSGLLAEKVGGPPVRGYQPEGIWEEATFGFIRYQQDRGEALYRRSLYQFWRRIVAPTMFFDVASRQTCVVKVERTNTPLQALNLLNDVTYVEAARVLAQRTLLADGLNDEARLALAFRRCTGRPPRTEETGRLLNRLADLRARYHLRTEDARKLLTVGEVKADPRLAPEELAAWTAVCTVLLNLDETICLE